MSFARYTWSGTQSGTNGGSVVKYNNKEYDTLNEYSTDTGRFTATNTGVYLVMAYCASVQPFRSLVISRPNYTTFMATLNPAVYSRLNAGSDTVAEVQGLIYLTAGQYVTIIADWTSTGTKESVGERSNYLFIARIA
jgi:hypothetical protein